MTEMYKRLFDMVLTDEHFELAMKLKDAKLIAEQVMTSEVMDRMSTVTGQKNDPKFMAYALINQLGITT